MSKQDRSGWVMKKVAGDGGEEVTVYGPLSGFGKFSKFMRGMKLDVMKKVFKHKLFEGMFKEIEEKLKGDDGPESCPCERCVANLVPITFGDVVQVAHASGEFRGLIGTAIGYEEGGEVRVVFVSKSISAEEVPEEMRGFYSSSSNDAAQAICIAGIPVECLVRIGRAGIVHRSYHQLVDAVGGKIFDDRGSASDPWGAPDDKLRDPTCVSESEGDSCA